MTQRTILVVEDDPASMRLIIRSIKSTNVFSNVITATNLEEALEKLETKQIDAAELDLEIPAAEKLSSNINNCIALVKECLKRNIPLCIFTACPKELPDELKRFKVKVFDKASHLPCQGPVPYLKAQLDAKTNQ